MTSFNYQIATSFIFLWWTIRIWEIITYQCIATLTTNTIRGVSASSDNQLISYSNDYFIKVYDTTTYQAKATLIDHTKAIKELLN